MAVLKKIEAVKVMDRRSDERVPCLFITKAILLTTPHRTEITVECVNISKGGLALRSPVSFQTGDHVAVKMQFCNRDGQVLLCEVRHCEANPGHFRIGLQTLDSISACQGDYDIPEKWLPQP